MGQNWGSTWGGVGWGGVGWGGVGWGLQSFLFLCFSLAGLHLLRLGPLVELIKPRKQPPAFLETIEAPKMVGNLAGSRQGMSWNDSETSHPLWLPFRESLKPSKPFWGRCVLGYLSVVKQPTKARITSVPLTKYPAPLSKYQETVNTRFGYVSV